MITAYTYDGVTLRNITRLITDVSITGDIAQAYRKAVIQFINTTDGSSPHLNVQLSAELRINYNKEEIFRGPMFGYNVDSTGNASITAYDSNYYLTKNKDTHKLENKKASEFIKELCSNYEIPVGSVADTGYVIPRLILRGRTLYDAMIIALTESEKKNNRTFAIINRGGKLSLIEKKKAVTKLTIENGRNLLSAAYSKTNENRYTQVELSANDGALYAVNGNQESKQLYGMMQYYEEAKDVPNQTALDELARLLLEFYDKAEEEYAVDSFGITSVQSGTAVVVNEKMSNLYGAYYVSQDTHKFPADGPYTMSLKLSRTLDIPREDYEEPEAESFGVSQEQGLPDAVYQGGFQATAYDPDLGGINSDGSPLDTATMTYVVPGRTMAVSPMIIPYGSVVAVRIPTMPKYNGIYLAEDTGQAIVRENGGKRLDLVIKGAAQAKEFGRRGAEIAILERGTGPADARAKAKKWSSIEAKYAVSANADGPAVGDTGKAAEVVRMARSFIGKLIYDFGGKNILSGYGDCSGFTKFIYLKVAGIDIGDGTSNQVTKGRVIPTSEARAGDVVFFKNTYRRGVSHVGIVTRPGYCVSLASKPSNCKEHGYTMQTAPEYWGQKFMQINRVL